MMNATFWGRTAVVLPFLFIATLVALRPHDDGPTAEDEHAATTLLVSLTSCGRAVPVLDAMVRTSADPRVWRPAIVALARLRADADARRTLDELVAGAAGEAKARFARGFSAAVLP